MLRPVFIGELHRRTKTLEVGFSLDDHDLRLAAGQGQPLVHGGLEAFLPGPLDDLQAHRSLRLGAVGGLVKGITAEAHRFVHPADGPAAPGLPLVKVRSERNSLGMPPSS